MPKSAKKGDRRKVKHGPVELRRFAELLREAASDADEIAELMEKQQIPGKLVSYFGMATQGLAWMRRYLADMKQAASCDVDAIRRVIAPKNDHES